MPIPRALIPDLPHLPPEPDLTPMVRNTKALAAFALYRDMGPGRSLRAVAARLGQNDSYLFHWARRYNWRELAAQYDMRVLALAERQEIIARLEDAKKRRKARLDTADVLRSAGLEAIERARGIQDISAAVAVSMLQLAASEERKDLDEPDQHIRVSDERPETAPDADPLRRYRDLPPSDQHDLLRILDAADRSASSVWSASDAAAAPALDEGS